MSNPLIGRGIIALLAFFSIIIFSNPVKAQAPPPTSEVSIESPKATSILRYGQFPVSLHTGLVDITIPIYTIEASGLSIPIQFKYHASGLKYDDTSNELGLGWTLMAGGVVSRSIRGALDNTYQTFSRDVHSFAVTCGSPGQLDNGYEFIREVENGTRTTSLPSTGRRDGEIDMYSFSFLGRSGSFCFPFHDSEVVQGTRPSSGGLFIPANGMKANLVTGNQAIEILDTDGIYYKFEVKDYDQNTRFKEYYLTQILTADKADTIDFTYEVMTGLEYIKKPFINYTASLHRLFLNAASYTMEESGGVFFQSLRPPRLTRIDFRGGYITFHYLGNTWDLQQIKVLSKAQDLLLQTVDLTKTTLSTGEKQLDKVNFTSGGSQYDYRFGYYAEPLSLFGYGPKGIDYWGFFNGASTPLAGRYVPNFPTTPAELNYTVDRNANANYARNGILNTIYYPTKGWSKFIYEGHRARYSQGTASTNMGGLRISQIENYLENGTLAEKKIYKYGIDESGDGVANAYPNISDFISTQIRVHAYDGGGIAGMVTDPYDWRYYSSFPRINYFISGSSTVYPEVTEYSVNTNGDYGKTVYRYEVFFDEQLSNYSDTYRFYAPANSLRSNSWKSGNLLSKHIYKKEIGLYQLVSSTQNYFQDINQAEFRNVKAAIYVDFDYDLSTNNPDILRTYCNHSLLWELYSTPQNPEGCPYDYYNYYTTTGLRVLSSNTETLDGVSRTTQYNSYTTSGLPTLITSTSSAGDVLTTEIKYPINFAYSPYTDMVSANIQAPVVEKTIRQNGIALKKEITGYGYFHSRFFAPLSYAEGYRSESQPPVMIMYDYDIKHNLRSVNRHGVTKGVYLWGYNYKNPVAEIRNATYQQVVNILGQPLIDRIGNATLPATADFQAIQNLRTSLPAAQITTYLYRPLIGISNKWDANRQVTSFEYDSFGRLRYIKDAGGSMTQLYEYKFKP